MAGDAANREACRRWRAKNREYERERHRQFRAENPDWWRKYEYGKKTKAKDKVSGAIRYGKLAKQPCEKCGSLRVQAHHDDYDRPLDVRWLCSVHHGEEHHV